MKNSALLARLLMGCRGAEGGGGGGGGELIITPVSKVIPSMKLYSIIIGFYDCIIGTKNMTPGPF